MAVSNAWQWNERKPLEPGVRGRRVCEGPLSSSESCGIRRRLQMTPRTGRAAKSSASVYPASGAGRRGREPPVTLGQPCQVCEEAGIDQQRGPDPRRRTGASGRPAASRCQLGGIRESARPLTIERRPRRASTGSIRPFHDTSTCPRAPGKTGSPVEITRAVGSSGIGWETEVVIPKGPGPTNPARKKRARHSASFFFFCWIAP